MRIINAWARNFASYKELDFNFENQGLTLIQGSTGSGKSTLCDLVPWVLFGRTAKNGTVNEVLGWNADGKTVGGVTLEIVSQVICVVRTRSANGKDNDFWYTVDTCPETRGKDMVDTQKMLNMRLGFDSEMYLSGAYFHEFSQTAQFFTTTAKNRRTICEQIVDLSLAKKLQLKTTEKLKKMSSLSANLLDKTNVLDSNIKLLEKMQVQEKSKFKLWEQNHMSTIAYIKKNLEKFEAERVKIIREGSCQLCGSKIEGKKIHNHQVNPYTEQLANAEKEINPHASGVRDFSDEITAKKVEYNIVGDEHVSVLQNITDLDTLNEVINDFRMLLIKNTIEAVQTDTNDMLAKYFDAEIRVEFSAQDADKLEVIITKDGNECAYTQLSKGQRQLLKLCFGVSIMKTVAKHNSVQFEEIFFDEALDGLDSNMKTRAFSLFQSLELYYKSIFVVEHELNFKSLFSNTYNVELVNGNSQICHL